MTDWMEIAREADFAAPAFRFADGSTLDLNLHYRVLGTLSASRDNAVLMLHGTTGNSKQFLQPATADFLFAKGRPLDLEKYCIILPDAIGHGGSSKPSDGLETAFPCYSYADVVAAQHLLVTKGLGLRRLRLVLGTSMGGMQTWMWGARYPDMMDALMPIASLPERVGGRNLLWRRLLIQIIRLNEVERDSSLPQQARSLGVAWNLFRLMVESPTRLSEALTCPSEADAYITKIADEALKVERVNDVIWEFDASRDYDPSPCLGLIEAPLLAVNFADDEINPVELGGLERAIAHVKHGRAITLSGGTDSFGHQTLRHAVVWHDYVRQLLQQTEKTSTSLMPADQAQARGRSVREIARS
jgi:homoserine O-acetyltransferase/O-succinyltransferase